MGSEVNVSRDLVLSSLGCAFNSATGALLMADLHVGIETSLEDEGFAMPRFQSDEMISRFLRAVDRFDPTVVIVNGDIKHSFHRSLGVEWNDVARIVDTIMGCAKPLILRGNHDNYLATILSKKNLQLKRHIVLGDVFISHGHETTTPWEGGMVLGHEHPAIRLRESTGASVKIPCFLFDPEENRLVLPAFSPLAMGSDIIVTRDEERMIPLLRSTGIGSYLVYGFFGDEILSYRSVSELRGLGRL